MNNDQQPQQLTVKEALEQGNKLIAEFMGGKVSEKLRCSCYPKGLPSWATRLYDFDTLKIGGYSYNESWDWLKPVVDKIFTYSLAYPDKTERLRNTKIVVDIIPCWNICIDFIKWYNTQKQ